ncbi:MAG: hypothetical protein JW747_08890, partial [Candidatus Aminicenantes bacterium]|nr:hypothetical protein [Candidatus Aminicenantes bacterium]
MKKGFLFLLVFCFLIASTQPLVPAENRGEKSALKPNMAGKIVISKYIPWRIMFSASGSHLACEGLEGSFNPRTGQVQISMSSGYTVWEVKKRKKAADLGETAVVGFTPRDEILVSDNGLGVWDAA